MLLLGDLTAAQIEERRQLIITRSQSPNSLKFPRDVFPEIAGIYWDGCIMDSLPFIGFNYKNSKWQSYAHAHTEGGNDPDYGFLNAYGWICVDRPDRVDIETFWHEYAHVLRGDPSEGTNPERYSAYVQGHDQAWKDLLVLNYPQATHHLDYRYR